ncbi:hypothetical protein [uncultured Cardiobacterium sp.]|mgnify:FL=1|nr:hypothetical protein [uncultured Cardiobacterium sp.]
MGIVILPDWAADGITIHALTATRLLPARVQCFLDFVREAAAEGYRA